MSNDENTYEDHITADIGGEPEAEIEPPYEPADVEVVAPEAVKRGPGWKAVILTGLLAGLVGAGAGAAALHSVAPKLFAADSTLERQIEAKISMLETRLAAAETQAAPTTVFDATALEDRLGALEARTTDDLSDRLTALEAMPRPEIDPDALSALQAAQVDGFDWPDTTQIEAVLISMDERLTELETAEPAGDGDASLDRDDPILEELRERLTTLETREPAATMPADVMARLAALEATPAPATQPRFVLAFPKAEMLHAVDANREGGFMERTLSKHVRVKSEDDPTTLINGIAADISEGDLNAAAAKFERLPAAIQAPGKAWYASVKDTP